jgi:hypothetical protein
LIDARDSRGAYFCSEHAYAHWNRNFIRLAIAYKLNIRETARLFAIVHTASADALIAGFNAKYFCRFWRPRTAIPRADIDGNPDTDSAEPNKRSQPIKLLRGYQRPA